MAEETKVENLTKDKLLEQYKLIEEENTLLKQAGNHDLSWYGREIDRLGRELEEKTAIIKGWESRKHEQEREAAVLAADAKAKEERELKAYAVNLDQKPGTRFRTQERPTIRDIYGDTAYPVFDLAIELVDYNGPVQVPVQFVIEMAQSIGMLTKEQADELNYELTAAKAKNEASALLGTELTNGISELVSGFYADLDRIAVSSVGEGSTESEDAGKSDSDSNESGKTDGQADSNNSGEKSNGVSGDSSNADDADNLRKELGL